MRESNRSFGLLSCFVLAALAGCSRPASPVDEVTLEQSGPIEELPPPAVGPADWPWWRGPSRNGVADAAERPVTEWSETENVVWKTPVPGRGHSSPTVVGDRVFLTTADEERQVQSVLGFDRARGEQLWKTDVSTGGFPQIHTRNSHATATIASDGERLFVAFCHHDAIQALAFDLEGQQLWQQTAGPYEPRLYEYGYAPSPLVAGSLVIIAVDCDGGGYLAAYHRKSGQLAWRTARPAIQSYSSPVVATLTGVEQLLISGCDRIASYDPARGKQLWSTEATTKATCGTAVWDGDLVFASGGFPEPGTYCVRADGSGVVWQNGQKCYEQSLLAHDGQLYAVDDDGVAYCWNAADGAQRWRRRLGGGISASPVLAQGHIYQTNENGKTFVFRADPRRFELIAENQLGDETFASPAVCGGQIFLRVASRASGPRQEWLYCLGGE